MDDDPDFTGAVMVVMAVVILMILTGFIFGMLVASHFVFGWPS